MSKEDTARTVEEFLEYLSSGEETIVLAYWSPQRNELMPILYTTDELAANFVGGKPAVSGEVKRAK